MDQKTVSEDIQIARIIISQWARKYNISEMEYNLVMDKLDAAAKTLSDDQSSCLSPENEGFVGSQTEAMNAPETDGYFDTDGEERLVAVDTQEIEESVRKLDHESETIEEVLPTMSEIEREIIMHETGEYPDEIPQPVTEKRSSDREALKSLYYDRPDANTPKERQASEESTAEAIGRMAHEINETETFSDRYADELLRKEYESKQVIGEVINAGTHVIGESYIPSNIVSGVTGKISLKKAIGLNDKYLLIRDLFSGETDLYEKSLTQLDEFTDLNDAMLYIHDNFHWDPNSEGAKLIVELLMNKLS